MSGNITFEILARDHASSVFNKVGSAAERSGTRIAKMHGHVSKVARSSVVQLGAFAGVAGIGAVIKSSVELEARYSKTMALVKAATNTPQSSMKALDALAMKMGAATQYSANQAAEAMLELGKAGVSTKDIMGGGLKNTLLLASAGGLQLGTAATIASNAMNAFNLRGKDMGRIAAALAGGANASSASVESLGMGLAQVGPGARNAGLSLQQTIGVLSAFDSAGIKGSDAGTSLKTMLQRLVPSTTAAKNEMNKLGLSFVKSNGSFDSITTVAQKLHDKLGPLTQAQRAQALQTMFGSDATRAASVLMNKGAAGLAKYIKATRDQAAAQKMSKAAMSGTAGALERMSGSVDTAKLAIGRGLAPTVVKLANFIGNKGAPAITRFVNQMQKGTGGGGRLVHDLQAIGSAAKSVIGVVVNLGKAFDSLPSSVKKAALLGGTAAYASHKLGLTSIGKSVASSAIKSVTGGVQKVFVVNPGFGGGGGMPGKIGTAESAAIKLSPVAAAGITAGVAAAVVGGFLVFKHYADKGSKPLRRELQQRNPTPAQQSKLGLGPAAYVSGGIEKLGKLAHDAAPATKTWAQSVGVLDASFSKLRRGRPDEAMFKLQDLSRKTGLSMGDLARVMPRTTHSFAAFKKAAAHMDQAMRPGTGTADIVRTALAVQRMGKAYRALPKAVQTRVATPGAIKSISDIQRLTTRYHLTPKQVRTLASLTDRASGTIRTVQGKLVKLGRTNPNPKATLVDHASGPMSRIRAEADALNGKHSTITITTLHVSKNGRSMGGGGGVMGAQSNAEGGLIRGAGTGTSDSILSWLSNGEWVTDAARTRKYKPLLQAIHNDTVPGYARGGPVVGRGSVHASAEGASLMREIVTGVDRGRVLLSTAMRKLTADISKQADKIATMISARRDMAAGYQGFKTSVFGNDFGDQPVTSGSILAFVKAQQQQAQQLSSDQSMVLSKGLSKALVTEFAGSGESGIAKLHALAGASPADIAQLNALDKSTTGSLAASGAQAGGYVYNSQIAAARRREVLDKQILHELRQLRHGGKVEVHVHIEGQTIVRSVKAYNKKLGQKSAGI